MKKVRITREVGGERENEFNKEDYLTCGQFAKLCQVKKQTLFHYDDIGLLRPALVNDKGYRFYTYRQYETYALIASLKEAGLSLAEIRDYLENRGAKSHLDTLREARERIHTRATYLEQVERAIATEIDRAEEAEALYTEDIVLMQLEELSLLRSPDLDRLDSAELIAAVKSFSAAHEVACAVLDTASLRQGEWDHYSFMLAFEPLGGEDARVAASILQAQAITCARQEYTWWPTTAVPSSKRVTPISACWTIAIRTAWNSGITPTRNTCETNSPRAARRTCSRVSAYRYPADARTVGMLPTGSRHQPGRSCS